ncbi:TetR/AcrR family transcriptional regulator [Paenibacillus sp. KQZ6P-2]|uniref:TetR/AcrR family transcriptional regulator n=1 Tax=Paenibacillus mangrovi TaxID=2931978 RepID=A0A9X1WT71_9BACL|nr:TetR/AcrR family transcriptional regulator [Paenibacillus mangrovi]MCJ8014817.1 TetR/AcrR family transcriptional regulator [Paenibacillus mangrovi]
MSPLSGEHLNQIRDERREQIIQAAIKVFSKRGIIGTKMSMIAAEAGISHGLVYHYFKTKDELFTLLIQGAIETSISSIEGLNQVSGSPIDKIRLLTKHILDKENTPFFMLIYQANHSDGVPEQAQHLIRKYPLQAYIDRLLPIFRDGQLAGEIVEGDLEEIVGNYFSILSGIMVLGEGYRIPEVEFMMRTITTI